MADISKNILKLKKERNAIILAHNYCLPEVQDIADFVGDSYGLSMKASETDADVIVFCGVSFMGETAKILNRNKTVLLPEPDALCAMAGMCKSEDLSAARKKEIPIVGYVNSTAACKAEMDVCCTSSNAVKIVKSLDSKTVLFVPDKNLGSYVAGECKDKKIILWDGFCPVHQAITRNQIVRLKENHKGAKILAHPECRDEVLEIADVIGSTEKMLTYCRQSDDEEFVVATEIGMCHRLEKECPGKKFYFPETAICGSMKMVDLSSVERCLNNLSGEITLSDEILSKAYSPVCRMVEMK